MKKVIINADDFGICQGINEGIIYAHQRGIVTSTTLMANMPGFEQAVSLAKQNKDLGIGLHLNIVRGRPVSPANKVKSLINDENKFFSDVFLILKRLVLGLINLEEVELEFRAQIEKILEKGIKISHFDSEKHVHSFPSIFKIIIRLAKEYNIQKIRFINEFCFSPFLFQTAKSLLISLACSSMIRKIIENDIFITDKFYGVCETGHMTSLRLKRTLYKVKDGITEIMVHPGFVIPEIIDLEKEIGSYHINKFREQELQALVDEGAKEVIKERKIHLINFNNI